MYIFRVVLLKCSVNRSITIIIINTIKLQLPLFSQGLHCLLKQPKLMLLKIRKAPRRGYPKRGALLFRMQF